VEGRPFHHPTEVSEAEASELAVVVEPASVPSKLDYLRHLRPCWFQYLPSLVRVDVVRGMNSDIVLEILPMHDGVGLGSIGHTREYIQDSSINWAPASF
jgi:hypothetical protein